MALRFPDSMDECIYFTNRRIGEGKVIAWVFKEDCPKCKKAKMGKPKNPKTGKPKIRATEYICPACNHTIPKKEYEETLSVNIQYTCPECKHEGELTTPFKRKTYKGVSSVIFECQSCNAKIPITKKMKAPKKKKAKGI